MPMVRVSNGGTNTCTDLGITTVGTNQTATIPLASYTDYSLIVVVTYRGYTGRYTPSQNLWANNVTTKIAYNEMAANGNFYTGYAIYSEINANSSISVGTAQLIDTSIGWYIELLGIK